MDPVKTFARVALLLLEGLSGYLLLVATEAFEVGFEIDGDWSVEKFLHPCDAGVSQRPVYFG